jgi:hypothetical protein
LDEKLWDWIHSLPDERFIGSKTELWCKYIIPSEPVLWSGCVIASDTYDNGGPYTNVIVLNQSCKGNEGTLKLLNHTIEILELTIYEVVEAYKLTLKPKPTYINNRLSFI